MVHKTINHAICTSKVENSMGFAINVCKIILLWQKWRFLRIIISLIVNLVLECWIVNLIMQIRVDSELVYDVFMQPSNISMPVSNLVAEAESRLGMRLAIIAYPEVWWAISKVMFLFIKEYVLLLMVAFNHSRVLFTAERVAGWGPLIIFLGVNLHLILNQYGRFLDSTSEDRRLLDKLLILHLIDDLFNHVTIDIDWTSLQLVLIVIIVVAANQSVYGLFNNWLIWLNLLRRGFVLN